ncbi:MAG TPA: hypothetical protein VFA21_20410 [Pyrinomonadaceae bacterium]|jgi:DNA-binding IclR family transcriptional regulator|nr:hypothetical protein [Pyrinomonadaceae bacterium]
MSRRERDEREYQLKTLAKGLRVLLALEGTNFEPVSVQRVAERTKLEYDFCRSALITLKLGGFAAEVAGKWTVGPKVMRFGANFNELCLAQLRQQSSGRPELETGGGRPIS